MVSGHVEGGVGLALMALEVSDLVEVLPMSHEARQPVEDLAANRAVNWILKGSLRSLIKCVLQ